MKRSILHVAVPSPLRKLFDYLPPTDCDVAQLQVGVRLLLPFGRQKNTIGFLLAIDQTTDLAIDRLKPIHRVLDEQPLLNQTQIDRLLWASRYYQHPIGEVIFASLPSALRQAKPCSYPQKKFYCFNSEQPVPSLKNAIKQQQLLQRFIDDQQPHSLDDIKHWPEYSAHTLRALLNKRLLQVLMRADEHRQARFGPISLPPASSEQQTAIDAISEALGGFQSFLLNGITGSGKTYVYMAVVRKVVEAGGQALILLPEIGLTPQFIQRFAEAFNTDIAIYHSALSPQQRLLTWMQVKDQQASIIIGTRSAVWLPLARPQVIIVDEEHDQSYKQQEGFRYSARDVAVYRARQENIPIVLGSATPSMESLHNVHKSLYQELQLTQRIGAARLPAIHTIDLKKTPMTGALSRPLLSAIEATLQHGQQVLLFINLRGYAPAILCHQCGHVQHCPRCERPMTYHKQRRIIWCHHCDKQLPISLPCPACDATAWIEVGHGTERIEEDIAGLFPDYQTVRIDRDTTRLKGSLEQQLSRVHSNQAQILIGTQMLAKGHDFPRLSLVGIVDMDSGLYSTDFRASERMAQLLTQVSGRAGRAENPGQVLLQTHFPNHPLLRCLIEQGYAAFARLLLGQRQESGLPPFSYHALLRAEATDRQILNEFLTAAKQPLQALNGMIQSFGPIPSAIPRKAGKYRMQLLLETGQRKHFAHYLADWLVSISSLPAAKKVRWHLDIDPQDMI